MSYFSVANIFAIYGWLIASPEKTRGSRLPKGSQYLRGGLMMPIAIIGLLGTYSFSMYIYIYILFIDSTVSDSIPVFLIEISSWFSSCFSKTWNFVTLYLAITVGKGHNNFRLTHISCRWLSIHFNPHSIWSFVRCYIVFYPHYILSNSASSWCQLIEWPFSKLNMVNFQCLLNQGLSI